MIFLTFLYSRFIITRETWGTITTEKISLSSYYGASPTVSTSVWTASMTRITRMLITLLPRPTRLTFTIVPTGLQVIKSYWWYHNTCEVQWFLNRNIKIFTKSVMAIWKIKGVSSYIISHTTNMTQSFINSIQLLNKNYF